MVMTKPATRPSNPRFSSGPCAKPPVWNLQALSDAALGRSHRAAVGKAKLAKAIDLTRDILRIPADYRVGIVPASDTGAFEMAMWSLLGARKAHEVEPQAARDLGVHDHPGIVWDEIAGYLLTMTAALMLGLSREASG